jgi:putative tryptophan/tyrosine transport system substrate-binding protein
VRRREFITLVAGAAAVWPVTAAAQEAGRTYRLGVVSIGPQTAPYFVAMFDEFRRAGFIEGQNLTIDRHSFGRRVDLIPKFVAEVVNAKPDVICVTGEPGIRAAQQATTTIPIIGFAEDMVGSGLVNSLAHPGGNRPTPRCRDVV